jgi:hypothetical protein
MANSEGTYRTTPERDQRAFDKLPRPLRDLLNEAPFNWSAELTLRNYHAKCRRMSETEAVAAVIAFYRENEVGDIYAAEQEDRRREIKQLHRRPLRHLSRRRHRR